MNRYFENIEGGEQEYCGKKNIRRSDIKEWNEQVETRESQDKGRVEDIGQQNSLTVPKQYIRALCGWLILSPPRDLALKGMNTIKEVEWHNTPQLGDEFSVIIKVLEKDPNDGGESNFPEVRLKVIGKNQNNEEVITYIACAMIESET